MLYRRSGNSGVKLPAVSLGLWHNFGFVDDFDNARSIIHKAFDLGITHFDLANNYGPPDGSAEENFGKILNLDLKSHRDELIISTKAGYYMWEGPYGEWGSRKYLISSCDQSLAQMAIAWLLRDKVVTSVLIGASSSQQLQDNVGSINNTVFSEKELNEIENILN